MVSLNKRFYSRLDNVNTAGDKANNYLIAIMNSAGTGKSALLAHFPGCDEYKQYVLKHIIESKGNHGLSISDDSPIICTLTLNNLHWILFPSIL